MPLPRAPVSPSDAVEAARILRAKSPVLPAEFRRLDAEAKKRAVTVTDEVSLDAIRSMRDALAKAKADGIPYREFVKTVGPTLGAQWGIDSPQLKTIFVNNVQQAANQAIVARLNRQRGRYPFWTLDVVEDEVTSSWCSYFVTFPVVLPAGHPWFARNAPMRHHRCRTTLRGLTAAEARKIGITKTPPDWPAQKGWGGSAPLGAYKANMSDRVTTMADRYAHIDFTPPKGVREEARRGLDWRREHGRGGTAVGVARARDLANGKALSPSTVRRMKAFFDRHQNGAGKGSKPGEDGFPSPWRIAWALWGGDAGYAWARKVVEQMNAADRKAMTMKDKKITAGLGQGDVHTDGPVKARRKFAKTPTLSKGKGKLGKVVARRGLSFRFSRGGTNIEVRHMASAGATLQCGSVELDETLFALDATGPLEVSKLIWIQLAKVGTFRGHPVGPFELTPQIFGEIVQNFRATQNQKIPIDFEHASEQDPTQGSIPHAGAPAQGWILDLDNRGAAGLWGLVEWLEPARSYIREKKYRFFSPAIRFGAKDRVSGQPIGARMTSGALTNNPFLDGMAPLAASDREAPTVDSSTETITMKMGTYEFEAGDVMPKLRMGLFGTGTHQADMATAAECYDAIERLEAAYAECVDEAPGAEMGKVQASLKRLRESMGLGMGITVPEMLELVKQMIKHMIGEHVEEMHPDEDPASSRDMGAHEMKDQEITIKMRDLEAAKSTLETKVAGLELQLADRSAKVTALEAEVVTLREAAKAREEADVAAKVELAFATYKDTHKLTDVHKRAMRITLLNDPKLFDEMYPPVAPDKRHLMRAIVPPGGARPTPEQGAIEARTIMGGGLSPSDMIALADKIQNERKCSREEALALAHKQAAPTSMRRSPFGMPGIG